MIFFISNRPAKSEKRKCLQHHGRDSVQRRPTAFLLAQLLKFLPVDTDNGVGRTGLHAGRTVRLVVAEVALVGFGLLRHHVQPATDAAHNRTQDHFHRAVRAGDHAGFAPDAALLVDVNKIVIAGNRPVRTDGGAGGIFALAAHGGGGDVDAFDDVNTRQEVLRGQRGAVLGVVVRHHAGHFTGTTADAFAGIGNDETVHSDLRE